MAQIICDICGKLIKDGQMYPRGVIKQKRNGKWCDIDVCQSCGDAMAQTATHSYGVVYDLGDLLKKENSNGTNNL